MGDVLQIRVNTINTNAKQGSYDAVEITGFDLQNNRGFKKKFFATKKDGSATKNAETAYLLNKDDWIEITLDDTSYKNVQTIKQISAPAGAEDVAPAQGGGSAGAKYSNKGKGGGGGGNNQMTKEEWAAKDRAKEASMARHKALVVANENSKIGTAADAIIAQAREFELYLLNRSETVETETGSKGSPGRAPETVEDDDIPF